jgi:hypothetical protein
VGVQQDEDVTAVLDEESVQVPLCFGLGQRSAKRFDPRLELRQTAGELLIHLHL